MMALSVAAVGDLVPRERIGRAMGLLGTVSAVGTALGPALGGLLVSALGWQAIFMTIAGLAVAALGASTLLLPADAVSEPGNMPPRVRAPLERLLLSGLLSIALVSAIVMATLVVGPFYLTGVLHLGAAQTGLVMSLGPAVAALTGIPAGRLVDRHGAAAMTLWGLVGVLAGTLAMIALPPILGTPGYAGSLALLTAGYALFQAANGTAVMSGAAPGRRGLISGLMTLARNLGLVGGASALGALYALGSHNDGILGPPAGGTAGLQLTFAAATVLAAIAIAATLVARR
jgi:predicted MFS family arabinose efflux permease